MDNILYKFNKNKEKNLKKIKEQGLSIIKLHEMLKEAGIKHDFIDNERNSFIIDYQILMNNEKINISMIQCDFSYGISRNEIEIYDFCHEPVTSTAENIFYLLKDNSLNALEDYILLKNSEKEELFDEIRRGEIKWQNMIN